MTQEPSLFRMNLKQDEEHVITIGNDGTISRGNDIVLRPANNINTKGTSLETNSRVEQPEEIIITNETTFKAFEVKEGNKNQDNKTASKISIGPLELVENRRKFEEKEGGNSQGSKTVSKISVGPLELVENRREIGSVTSSGRSKGVEEINLSAITISPLRIEQNEERVRRYQVENATLNEKKVEGNNFATGSSTANQTILIKEPVVSRGHGNSIRQTITREEKKYSQENKSISREANSSKSITAFDLPIQSFAPIGVILKSNKRRIAINSKERMAKLYAAMQK